jgi:signal peptidase I
MASSFTHRAGVSRLAVIGIIGLLALAVSPFIAGAYYVPTVSMANTLLPGDFLLMSKVGPANPAVGDIVAFRSPANPESIFLKRVAGRPGDRIRIVNKRLYRNGQPTTEPYSLHNTEFIDNYRDNFPATPNLPLAESAREMLATCRQGDEIVVPAGHYFVLGDNRDNSLDSRYLGLIPAANLVGHPLGVYWSKDEQGHPRWSRIGHRVR